MCIAVFAPFCTSVFERIKQKKKGLLLYANYYCTFPHQHRTEIVQILSTATMCGPKSAPFDPVHVDADR